MQRMVRPPQIIGIVNITQDSFSDGGRYFAPGHALAHARALRAAGAHIIELGAESSHPDSRNVPADEQIRRLRPVLSALKADGACVSIDASDPAVIRAALESDADIINDVTALADPRSVAALRFSGARVILMHAVHTEAPGQAPAPRAERIDTDPGTIVSTVLEFFRARIGELAQAGIDSRRLIIDPGMGMFLGRRAAASVAVLRALPQIRALALPVCICTSRKSFLDALAGRQSPVSAAERGAVTLASELFAAIAGADFIRTHDVAALRDALNVWQALTGAD